MEQQGALEYLGYTSHAVWLIRYEHQAGRYAPNNRALKERARAARRWLKARPEKEIVMVTHGGFLHYFTEDWEDSSQFQGTCHRLRLHSRDYRH